MAKAYMLAIKLLICSMSESHRKLSSSYWTSASVMDSFASIRVEVLTLRGDTQMHKVFCSISQWLFKQNAWDAVSPSYIVGGVPSSLTCSVILEKKTTTTTIHCQFFSYQLRNHLVTKVTVKIWEHCYKEVQHGQTIRQVVNQLKVFDSDCLKRYLEVKFKGSKWVKVEP